MGNAAASQLPGGGMPLPATWALPQDGGEGVGKAAGGGGDRQTEREGFICPSCMAAFDSLESLLIHDRTGGW